MGKTYKPQQRNPYVKKAYSDEIDLRTKTVPSKTQYKENLNTKTEATQMIKLLLLPKIEQDYGLPVAISFAKQAIKQNLPQTITLRGVDTPIVFSVRVLLTAVLNWRQTNEGEQFWRDMYHRYVGIKFLLSYNDLEEYAAKHANIKTVTIDTMQKILKEPKMAMIAPFNKGSLNIKGVIHQAAKGIKDDRPFVVALIDEELERVKTAIKNNPRDAFNYEGYDIRVHHLKNLILESETTIEAVEDFKITPLLAIRFYEFEKLIKKPLDCSWIKSYLTQENMQKPSVSLFKSNKMSIKLENGIISLVDFKTNRTYNTPVLYDKTKNEFYL